MGWSDKFNFKSYKQVAPSGAKYKYNYCRFYKQVAPSGANTNTIYACFYKQVAPSGANANTIIVVSTNRSLLAEQMQLITFRLSI